jgi:glycolate oxidase FAD binding subunit
VKIRTPSSLEEVQAAVQSVERVHVIGAGTKPALSQHATISTAAVSGVLEYNPSEYTFTALAGTPLAELEEMLGKHNQFLPFDPPLVEAGATLGGTVAAGLSGPGRYRFGGVRDFFLGVRMVTTGGRIVFGGGKVVKNAAGFDIPKFNVGALGRYGVMVELTFKVFPRPESWTTISAQFQNMTAAIAAMNQVAMSPVEASCLDLTDDCRILVRLGGIPDAQVERANRVKELLAGGDAAAIHGDEEAEVWRSAREFAWAPSSSALLKVPLLPDQILALEERLTELGDSNPRRYSVGGNVAWVSLSDATDANISALHESLGRNVLALRGPVSPITQHAKGRVFEERLEQVFSQL